MSSFTHQLRYKWLQTADFYASRNGDEVFLCGERALGGSHVVQRYNRTGQLLNTWQVKCGHGWAKHLLHLSIDNTPYIAVSCWGCQSITLYSMTDDDPITAYCHSREDQAQPAVMCHGPNNTILVTNWEWGSKEVLMYDVSSTQFILKDRIPVDVDQSEHIHYMETAKHGGIVIASFGHVISACSIETKKLVWEIKNKKIEGELFSPCGICSDPDTSALYVGDYSNERLIVIEANTGEVIQSIQLHGVGRIPDISWCSVQPHIVIQNHNEGLDRITYYDIK